MGASEQGLTRKDEREEGVKEGRKADGNHQKKGMQEERLKEREIEERERERERERDQ